MTQKEQQQTTEQPIVTNEGEESEQSTGMQRGESKSTGIERPQRGGLGRAELFTSPFTFMQRMMDEMDRMFSRFGFGGGITPTGVFDLTTGEGIWSPVIETFERDGRVVLRADLPGLELKDVKVEVIDDELVISGERKHEKQETSPGRFYSERRYGSFERRITLPADCKPEDIDASFENGVLEVSFAVHEERPKAKRIEVKTGKKSEGESGPRSVH